MITCLHGFLGNPRDWDFLRDAGFAIETPPLDAIPDHGDLLLGYSLGGRLALQTLLNGAHYNRAILVSTGLGIEDEGLRAARRASDEAWARRFESEDFDTVTADWNAQPVLAGPSLPRTRDDFDPRALREWSSGALPPVASRLHELTIQTLWIAGARDSKYVAEAHRGASLARGRVAIVDGAGHRVPWEATDAFLERLKSTTEAQRTQRNPL